MLLNYKSVIRKWLSLFACCLLGLSATGFADEVLEETGTLTVDDDQLEMGEYFKVYEVSGNAGEFVVIDLESKDFDPYLMLGLPADDTILAQNDDWEGSREHSRIEMMLPTTGEYQILVTTYAPGEVGAYTLTMSFGGVTTSAPSVGVDSLVAEGTLEIGDDLSTAREGAYVDWYDFECAIGQTVRFEVTTTDGLDPYLNVYAPTGDLLWSNDDLDDQRNISAIEETIPLSGTYRVEVTSYASGATGAYRLEVRETDAMGFIEVPSALTGTLEEGDEVYGGFWADAFVFEASSGQRLLIDMASAEFDTCLHLIMPDGTSIPYDDSDFGTDAHVDFTVQQSGIYGLVASSYSAGESGNYDLTLSLDEQEPPVDDIPPDNSERRLFGVFVGIDLYDGPNDQNPLHYCGDDAMELATLFEETYDAAAYDCCVLIEDQATIANVSATVEDICTRADEDDMVVFFFAGHGGSIKPEGDDASTFDPADPNGIQEVMCLWDGNLGDDDFSHLFDNCRAETTMVVLQCCESGGFSKDFVSRPGRMGVFASEEDVTAVTDPDNYASGVLPRLFIETIGTEREKADLNHDSMLTAFEFSFYLQEQFETQPKDMSVDIISSLDNLEFQRLVIDRGGLESPHQVLFRW